MAWGRKIHGATVEVTARFRPSATGAWRIGLAGTGPFRLFLDGELVLDEVLQPPSDNFVNNFLIPPQRAVARTLAEGDELDVVLVHSLARSDLATLTFGVEAPRRPDDQEFAHAIDIAKKADAAVVVVGTTERVETEGLDRTSLALPDRQDDLVRAVAAVNPQTVVVVNTGGPVTMPWRDEVAAVLLAWFPGQEFGHALADVLLGVTEPGGTFRLTAGASVVDQPLRCDVEVIQQPS